MLLIILFSSQGPKPKTISDFWTMIWQEEVYNIVCLTNLTEGTKVNTKYIHFSFIYNTIKNTLPFWQSKIACPYFLALESLRRPVPVRLCVVSRLLTFYFFNRQGQFLLLLILSISRIRGGQVVKVVTLPSVESHWRRIMCKTKDTLKKMFFYFHKTEKKIVHILP